MSELTARPRKRDRFKLLLRPAPKASPQPLPVPVPDDKSSDPVEEIIGTPRSLWQLAFEQLAPDQTVSELKGHVGDDPAFDLPADQLLSQVRDAAVKKRQEAQNGSRVFVVNGRRFTAREVSDKIVNWLDKFKAVGDLAVQIDPQHAALPWAAFRFLLIVATSSTKQHNDMLLGIERSLHACFRCNFYERQYLGMQQKQSSSSEAQKLKDDIVRVYTAVLLFLALAMRCSKAGTVKNASRELVEPDRFAAKVAEISSAEDQLEKMAALCERHLQHQWRQNLSVKMSENDSTEALTWISKVHHEDDLARVNKTRGANTCGWLLAHKTYQGWIGENESTTLWLHGIPGAGKTHLSSKVIDDLRARDQVVAYFFCGRDSENHHEPIHILHSLVKQLGYDKQNRMTDRSLVEAYQRKKRSGFASNELSLEECQELLATLIDRSFRVHIVIDGLDECDRRRVNEVLEPLDLVVKSTSTMVKIFIASRDEREIRQNLGRSQGLEIKVQNQDDIEDFVLRKIESHLWASAHLEPEVRNKVIRLFRYKSQGMFLWAVLHIEDLLDFESNEEVCQYLDGLPVGLEKTYETIYAGIDARLRHYVDNVFMWIMAFDGPKPPAFLCVMATQDPQSDFKPNGLGWSSMKLLSLCRNLIRVNLDRANEPTCEFSHLSVREYLETHRNIQLADAKKLVFSVLIRLWEWGKAGNHSDNAGVSPMLFPAQKGTANVFRMYRGLTALQKNSGMRDVMLGFLGNPLHHLPLSPLPIFKSGFESRCSISVCIDEDLVDIVEAWLENGSLSIDCTFNADFSDGPTDFPGGLASQVSLLWYACSTLCASQHPLKFVRMLLERGANPNYRPLNLESPLATACGPWGIQCSETTRLLLENGAEIEDREMADNVLMMLKFNESKEMIRLVLSYKPQAAHGDFNDDPRFKQDTLWDALCDALYYERFEIADMIIDAGFDMTSAVRSGLDLLQEMVESRAGRGLPLNFPVSALDYLFRQGFKPDVADKKGDTPLHFAASIGRGDIVKSFLMQGMHAGIRNKAGDTPLHSLLKAPQRYYAISSFLSHGPDIIQCLVNNGLDVNCTNLRGETAFHWACCSARELLNNLISHGADTKIIDQNGRTSLHWLFHTEYSCSRQFWSGNLFPGLGNAKDKRSRRVEQLAIDVDVNHSDKQGTTALHLATQGGVLGEVSTLLKLGAETNHISLSHGTALHVAAAWAAKERRYWNRSVETIDLLCETLMAYGASPDAVWETRKFSASGELKRIEVCDMGKVWSVWDGTVCKRTPGDDSDSY